MEIPKINTEEMRRIGSVAKEKSLSDSGQITAGKMLNRAADHIDNLTTTLSQEQRDHAATKAELARMREEYEKQGEALIFTERARSNANAGRQTNERYIEQLKAELARMRGLLIRALAEFTGEGMHGTADHYRKMLEVTTDQC